jgi:hypothetical protein
MARCVILGIDGGMRVVGARLAAARVRLVRSRPSGVSKVYESVGIGNLPSRYIGTDGKEIQNE